MAMFLRNRTWVVAGPSRRSFGAIGAAGALIALVVGLWGPAAAEVTATQTSAAAAPAAARVSAMPGTDAPRVSLDSSSVRQTTGRTLRLETIEVAGNKRTSPAMINRYLMLSPGDEINVDILEANRQRLLATGYFKTVEFSTRPGSERGTVILVIAVDERGFPTFETGFGYDDLYGWFLTLLGLRFDNPLGIESQFRIGLRLGFRISGMDAEWIKPAPPGGGFGYGARGWAYNQRQFFYVVDAAPTEPLLRPRWEQYDQDISRIGGELAFAYHAGGPTRFSFGIRAESNKPDSIFTNADTKEEFGPDDLPESIRSNLGQHAITGLFFRAIRDTRDHGGYPQSGSFALLTLELNNTLLGGDYIFSKAVGDYRKHFSLGNKTVFSSRIKGGFISGDAPYYGRFFLGGNYTVRGFREWSLSAPGGDGRFWLVNAELRTPLVDSRQGQPRLTGLLFFDAGQGWNREDTYSLDDVESAVGYGLRLRLPWLGTLGTDIGIPLSEGRTGDEFRVHVLLGFSF
jgi:outer membrane protein assembly factor BamA